MEIYLHIPFCAQKCRYCDFASYAGRLCEAPRYVEALLKEADASPHLHAPVETAFIGGGTPSMLPAPLLDQLLTGIHNRFDIAPDAEFTTEANPGTLTKEWLDVAVSHGINRLSMGMQAYQPRLLRTLGRIHDFDQVAESVQLARAAGITNISLDLMFGLPGQTRDEWRESLLAALSLSPHHLSCYGLIPEEGTPLKAQLDDGTLTLPDEVEEREMYDDTLSILSARCFVQYEISNFALPGRECRHNIGYWQQTPYLGLGCSASSMLPDPSGANSYLRVTNPALLDSYLHMAEQADWASREVEAVSATDAQFETLMLGLRMTRGVSEADYAVMHGEPLTRRYGATLTRLAADGLLSHADGHWFLTRRGMDVQNAVLVELMED